MIHAGWESWGSNTDSGLTNVQTTTTPRGLSLSSLHEKGGLTRCYTPQGVEYECNYITGERRWVNDEQHVQGGRLNEVKWSSNTSTPQSTRETEEWVRYHTPEGAEYECSSITGESRWVIHQQQCMHEQQRPQRGDEGNNSNPFSMQGSRRPSCYSYSPQQPFQANPSGVYYSSGNRAFFEPYQLATNSTQPQLDIDYGSGGIEGGEEDKELWLSSRRKHGNRLGGGMTSLTSLLTSQFSRWTLSKRETGRNNNCADEVERPTTESSLLSQFASWALFSGQTGSSKDDWEDGPGTDSFISQLMSWVSSWHFASNWDNLRAVMPPFLS